MTAPPSRAELRQLDTVTRTLSAAESVKLGAYRFELEMWSRYVREGGVGTYAEACATDRLLYGRPQRPGIHPETQFDYVTGIVYPERAQRFMAQRLLRPGESPPKVVGLEYALRFMGVDHDAVRPWVQTFTPHGERNRANPYRHRGWWLLSHEVLYRLEFGHHVPVLTGMRGRRPRHTDAEAAALSAPEARMRALEERRAGRTEPDVRIMVRVLRDYLRSTEPTCLLRRAEAEHLPVVRTRRGQPRLVAEVGERMPQLADDATLLVSPAALAAHAERAAGRLELPRGGWTAELVERLLDRVAAAHPSEVGRVSRFATVDARGPRAHGGRWFRVSCGWAGCEAPNLEWLTGQWREHVKQLRRWWEEQCAAEERREQEWMDAMLTEDGVDDGDA